MIMVTQNDVAKRAGVSNAVVSYVINNGPRPTSPKTRQKVLQAIDELGYRANYVARSLKTNKSKVIGIVIPDSANAFFSEVAKGIEDKAYECGYTVMFGNTGGELDRQINYVETLVSQMVDGIIFITTPFLNDQISTLRRYHIPVIIIDPECELDEQKIKDIGIISVDGRKGGYLAGTHLLERHHTRIAIIAGAQEVPPATVRITGFVDALSKTGIDVEVYWAGDHPEDGYKSAKQIINSPQAPTAIFACNDLLALGVIRAAADLEIKVPDDLAIVGFDDIDMASFLCPRLTTIRQPKYKMGYVAAENLLGWIASNEKENQNTFSENAPGLIILDTELIVREST